MMDVLREAPLKWFSVSKTLLVRLNRLSDLRVALQSAKIRVNARPVAHPLLSTGYASLNRLGQGIGKALFASQQLVLIERKRTAAMDLIALNRLGWNETAVRAKEVLSLGDLIDGSHGRMAASRDAAAELDQIERVATCLYLRFGQVLPSIRLDWAERLSQFDAPVNLRNLYSLPRWGEVDNIERREIQMLVDWLYQRIDAAQSQAVSLISDLVRICILLASHAPVNKIIAGRIPEPVTVRVGSRIDITADLARVRIGQNVMVQAGGRTVARATIDDITDGRVSASVLTTVSETLTLERDTKVQIGEPRSIGGRQASTVPGGLLPMTGLRVLGR